MSSSITEARRIADPRSKLKNIIDAQAAAIAEQIQVDDTQFLEQSVSSLSRLTYFDQGLDLAFNGDSTVQFFTPFEPDGTILTVHLYLENLGNYARDYALLGNRGIIGANPDLVEGIDTGGLGAGFCLHLDGDTQYIDVASKNNIRITGLSGFSICCNFKPDTLAYDQFAKHRTIAAKSDDANNAYRIALETNGDLLFNVMYAGTEYKVRAPNQIHLTNPDAWYRIACVFDNSASPKVRIYFNNILFTASSTVNLVYPAATATIGGDTDLHIGRSEKTLIKIHGGFDPLGFDPAGFDTNNVIYDSVKGAFQGAIQDFRFYAKALSTAEVNNLWTNKFTIYDAPLKQIGLAGYSVAN
jgi:hypothetical protein